MIQTINIYKKEVSSEFIGSTSRGSHGEKSEEGFWETKNQNFCSPEDAEILKKENLVSAHASGNQIVLALGLDCFNCSDEEYNAAIESVIKIDFQIFKFENQNNLVEMPDYKFITND